MVVHYLQLLADGTALVSYYIEMVEITAEFNMIWLA